MIEGLRVAAYGRYVLHGNVRNNGYAELVWHFSSWICNTKEWVYAGVYADSGNDHKELDRLLADSRAGKIDLVLVPGISVLDRDALLKMVRILKGLNIDIFFEAEEIHTLSEDGEAMISVLASFSRQKADTSPKNQPYGFEDAKEAEVVKRIFSLYMEGYARKAIAQVLNKERIPNPKDSLWRDIDIRRIITEEGYRGHLIEPEAFDAALATKEKRTKAHHYREPYGGMFGGIITCGVCGNTFSHRERGKSTNWVCRKYLREGPAGCPSKCILERRLKETIAPLLGEKGLEEVENITVYPDGRLIVTIDDVDIERRWKDNRKESTTILPHPL